MSSATLSIEWVTTPPPTRGQRRKERTVEAVLDAASRLFFENGVHRTTIDELAERADVSVGAIYFNFKSKEGVYLALIDRALDVNEQYMAAAAPDPSPLVRVLNAGDAYLRFFLDRPEAFRLIALRVLEPNSDSLSEVEQQLADRVDRLVGRVRADLGEAVVADEIVRVDLDDATRFLWGAWNGVIAMSVRQDRLQLTAEQVTAALAVGRGIVRRGLATSGNGAAGA